MESSRQKEVDRGYFQSFHIKKGHTWVGVGQGYKKIFIIFIFFMKKKIYIYIYMYEIPDLKKKKV